VGRARRADGLTTRAFVRAYPSGGMAGERRLNWGADATDAKWRSEHDTTNSRFVVAEDLDGGTVVLEIDETAGEVVSRYPVNLSGNNLVDGTTTVYDASTDTVGDGTTIADHASVSTGELMVNQIPGGFAVEQNDQISLRFDESAFLQAFAAGTQLVDVSGSEILLKVGGSGGASTVARFNVDGSLDLAGTVNENSL